MIRADATPTMGAGHIMRSIALAQAWQSRNGEVIFVCAAAVPLALERLRREGFKVESVPAEPGSPEDAALTKSIVERHQAKWVAIDGYHFGADYLRALQTSGSKTLVIDDEGRPFAIADVILNQNLHATAAMYPERDNSSLLLGTRFAMLRKEFIEESAGKVRQIPQIATKILVTFGGGNHPGVLNEALGAVAALGSEVEVAVVGCEPSQHLPVGLMANVKFLGTVLDMPSVMAWAGIAVSAAGSTCWELCRLGVPSVVIDVADNQRPLGRELDARGIAVHIARERADATSLLHALLELLPDEKRRREMSAKGMELIDGKGSHRVVAALRAQRVTLRDARAEDARLLWNWANDPTVRAASFSSHLIAWGEHCDWIARQLRDEKFKIWVAEESGNPIGTIRAHKTGDDRAELGVTIAPELRGQGLASYVIRLGVERAMETLRVSELHALIKPQNLSSISAFENAGFELNEGTMVNGCEAVRYVQSCLPERDRDPHFSEAIGR